VIDAVFTTILREVAVGTRPNGLAWGPRRKHLLVADVQDNNARLVDPKVGRVIATAVLPGRPRWALYVAIRDPGVIDVVNTATLAIDEQIATEVGAHTTAFDMLRQRLYVFLPSCRVAVYEESEVK